MHLYHRITEEGKDIILHVAGQVTQKHGEDDATWHIGHNWLGAEEGSEPSDAVCENISQLIEHLRDQEELQPFGIYLMLMLSGEGPLT